MEDSTISSVMMGRSYRGDVDVGALQPQLFLVASCDQPLAAPSRHLLAQVDEVALGRGEPEVRRDVGARRLHLRRPDGRMSVQHARLVRVHGRWLLEDLGSKNGTLVDGAPSRRAILEDGTLFELGHTFFLFREAPAPTAAPADVTADALGAPLPALATFVAELEAGFSALARVAASPVSVLVLGETGTGKEVVAQALHQLSGRPGPFVPVNCGALTQTLLESELFGHRKGAFSGAITDRPGLVRSASGGTLFLDEIGELPPASQVAFLRVLQEQEVVPVGESRPVKVDLRICAATHRDLDALIEADAFRRDLAGRLMGLPLALPPLRARKEDLGLLIRALLSRLPGGGGGVSFTPVALRLLFAHDWPSNVRELDKCLTTAVALAGGQPIDRAHLLPTVRESAATLPVAPAPAPAPASSADDRLRARLHQLLVEHEGNVAAVARAMGKGRMQIHRWARRFGLELDSFRRSY